jgi:non-ribosomal peptide synthetase component F
LGGPVPSLPEPLPYREFVKLENQALTDSSVVRYFQGLPLGRLRSAPPLGPTRLIQHSAGAVLTDDDVRQLMARALEWGLPVKSLLLAVCGFATGAVEQTSAPIVGLMMNGRPEVAGGDVTLGLFLNQLPLCLQLQPASWRQAARLALEAENGLLPYRRFPYSELRQLLGSDPFAVTFNYVHFHPRDELIKSGIVAPEEDMRGAASLAVVVEAFFDPQAEGLGVQVTADARQYERSYVDEFLSLMLRAIRRVIAEPDAQVLPARRHEG